VRSDVTPLAALCRGRGVSVELVSYAGNIYHATPSLSRVTSEAHNKANSRWLLSLLISLEPAPCDSTHSQSVVGCEA